MFQSYVSLQEGIYMIDLRWGPCVREIATGWMLDEIYIDFSDLMDVS